MDRLKRDVILIRLTEALLDQGSWCGETHLQKATFFLQEMVGAKTGFPFILYKHGPFSFELRDELTAMRADGMIGFRIQAAEYGPSIVPESGADSLKQRFPKTLRLHEPLIQFVASRFQKKPVVELERLGTALYVLRELGRGANEATCVQRIRHLKPHIAVDQANDAVRTVKEWQKEAEKLAVPA